jgi:ribosome maturation factor RimP
MRNIDPILYGKLVKLIDSMGYELIGCELVSQNRDTVFRLYIDIADAGRQKNISLDDCTRVSHQVSAMLDVEDPIRGQYTLEVSSPGINRPLFELKHYQKFIGNVVKIKLHMPINQRRQYKGILQKVEGDNIYLLSYDSNQEVVLPFSAIEKANLIVDV